MGNGRLASLGRVHTEGTASHPHTNTRAATSAYICATPSALVTILLKDVVAVLKVSFQSLSGESQIRTDSGYY